MIEPTSQKELGFDDEQYKFYEFGFYEGKIKGLERGKDLFYLC